MRFAFVGPTLSLCSLCLIECGGSTPLCSSSSAPPVGAGLAPPARCACIAFCGCPILRGFGERWRFAKNANLSRLERGGDDCFQSFARPFNVFGVPVRNSGADLLGEAGNGLVVLGLEPAARFSRRAVAVATVWRKTVCISGGNLKRDELSSRGGIAAPSPAGWAEGAAG